MKNNIATRGLKDAVELNRAKKEHRLPENLTTQTDSIVLTKEHVYSTTLAYLLADVNYSIMYDLCAKLIRHGKDLRHDTKRRLNEYYKVAERFRNASQRVSKDVFDMGDNATLDYIDDADDLRELIMLLYDRLHGTADAKDRIRALLFNMPKGGIFK